MRTCRVCAKVGPDELFVKNGKFRKNTCRRCDADRVRAYQKVHSEQVQAKNKAWVERSMLRKEAAVDRAKRYAERYPDRAHAAKRKYRTSDKGRAVETAYDRAYKAEHKLEIAKRAKRYQLAHPEISRRVCRERYARKKHATVAWANKFFIEEAYMLAVLREKICGGKWHVDHMVPLKSKFVCGLHTEHNLQVIPASVNLRKRNLYWPDMPASITPLRRYDDV